MNVIMQSIEIMQHELVINRQIASDLMMRPAVEQFSSRAFTHIEDIIRVGEVEAEKIFQTFIYYFKQWKGENIMFKRFRFIYAILIGVIWRCTVYVRLPYYVTKPGMAA